MAQYDSFGREIWVPADKPYRVCRSFPIVGHPHHASQSTVYATLDEATKAFADAQARRFIALRMDIADNAETWQQNGKWRNLKTIRPKRTR